MIQNIRKTIRAGVFTLALSAVPFAVSASAQSNNNANTSAPSTRTSVADDRDDSTDLGWLGLIGLAGLAGLLKKPRQQVVVDRSADTMNRSRAA